MNLINNSPYPSKFSISILRGFHSAEPEQSQIQTPYEKGRELTEKILIVTPSVGVI